MNAYCIHCLVSHFRQAIDLQRQLNSQCTSTTAKSELEHNDQGYQFTSHEWQRFWASHNLQPSISRRGSCHDNTVAKIFFQLLKRERVRKQTYAKRQEACSSIFSYVEMFYNPIRRHSPADGLFPVALERRNFVRLAAI